METTRPKTDTVRPEPGIGAALSATGSFVGGCSSIPNMEQALRHVLEVSSELRTTAEDVFMHMDETMEDNVFLNVPNLIQLLILMASVGHSIPSMDIKQLVLKPKKDDGSPPLDHSGMARLVCAGASRDLTSWELNIKQQCLFNEYQSRRRLFINRLACRSFAFRTFQALNSLLIEVKISSGGEELNCWAMGGKRVPTGLKSVFKIWESEDDKEKTEEKEKPKKEVKPPLKPTKSKMKGRDGSTKEPRVPPAHKCPILMTATEFEIPVHPFILDMSSTYTLGGAASPLRAVRFVNDSSKLLKHYKIGVEHRGVRIPCRLKDTATSMEMMVFWSGKNAYKDRSILRMVDAVLGGGGGAVQAMAIKELQLPLWELSLEAQNIAHSISKRISDHLFAEGGFGDLADMRDVRASADPSSRNPPSFQAFDYITIRTPSDEEAQPRDLDKVSPQEGEGIVRVSLPYYMVIYDHTVKCPVYFARIAKPMAVKDTVEDVKGKWSRPFPCSLL